MYMSVTMVKSAEKSIVDCYIKRKKVVITTTSTPVAKADEGYDTVH